VRLLFKEILFNFTSVQYYLFFKAVLNLFPVLSTVGKVPNWLVAGEEQLKGTPV
jgi:hypothetical protein